MHAKKVLVEETNHRQQENCGKAHQNNVASHRSVRGSRLQLYIFCSEELHSNVVGSRASMRVIAVTSGVLVGLWATRTFDGFSPRLLLGEESAVIQAQLEN